MFAFIQSPYFLIAAIGIAVLMLWRRKPVAAAVEEQPLIMMHAEPPAPPTSEQAFAALHIVDARLELLGYDEAERKDLRDSLALRLLSPSTAKE